MQRQHVARRNRGKGAGGFRDTIVAGWVGSGRSRPPSFLGPRHAVRIHTEGPACRVCCGWEGGVTQCTKQPACCFLADWRASALSNKNGVWWLVARPLPHPYSMPRLPGQGTICGLGAQAGGSFSRQRPEPCVGQSRRLHHSPSRAPGAHEEGWIASLLKPRPHPQKHRLVTSHLHIPLRDEPDAASRPTPCRPFDRSRTAATQRTHGARRDPARSTAASTPHSCRLSLAAHTSRPTATKAPQAARQAGRAHPTSRARVCVVGVRPF